MLFVHKGTVNWSKNKENAEILRFFINFPRKILVVREKVVPLHPQNKNKDVLIARLWGMV